MHGFLINMLCTDFFGLFTKIITSKIISLGLKETTSFLFFAIVSLGFALLWGEYGIWFGLPIAFGIFLYGLTYFLVHDIFIHQRFKLFRNSNNKYARGIKKGSQNTS